MMMQAVNEDPVQQANVIAEIKGSLYPEQARLSDRMNDVLQSCLCACLFCLCSF